MGKLFKKLNTTPEGWITNPKERRSYYLFFCGQNIIYNLVATYLLTYITLLGLEVEDNAFNAGTKASLIILIVKIWDAVNDAVFGVIFDKVRFKSGKKFLPWIRISTALTPIATVLIFIIPNNGAESLKLAWLAVAYILWDTAYTLNDVPIYGIVTSMTENLSERTSLLAYKGIWSGIGSGLTTIFATLLLGEAVTNFFENKLHMAATFSFSFVAIVLCVLAALTMIPAGKNIEERFNGENEEQFTVKMMLNYLIHNKYLLIYYFGYFFYSGANVANALTLLASYFLFGKEELSLVVGAVNLVPSAIFAFLVPAMVRKMDKMKLYKICAYGVVATSLIIWLAGYKSFILFVILTTIRSIPLSIIGILAFMFTPDCAEYGKYTTGISAKGITFAIQTFMVKLAGAVSTALPLFILSLPQTGWKTVNAQNFAELAKLGIDQPDSAKSVLWFLFVMLPGIGCLIAAVIWEFYKLNDKDVQIMADVNTGKLLKKDAESMLSRKY